MPTSVAVILLVLAPPAPDDPPKPAAPPAAAPATAPAPAGPTFRFAIQQFDAGKKPIGRGEVIASRGRLYYIEKSSNEVAIVEPARKSIHLVDIKLGLAADLSYGDLDSGIAANREEHRKAVEAHAHSKARGERIDAEIRRDMTDPRFRVGYDEPSHMLRLSNPTAQVERRGEPDGDPARLAAIAEALGTLAKLRSYRDPDNLRHFVEVEAVSALVDGRKLRPIEMTYLFRLAGPPEKHRWTYSLAPEVTEEDRKGLDLIEVRLLRARHVPFDRYDRRVDPDEVK